MVQKTDCCYKTPCGWCSKWDKICDLKIGNATDVYEYRDFAKTYMEGVSYKTTSADGHGETLGQN